MPATPRKSEIRTIAFYLPQFHPIPENDLWWGKGFTEWTNTAKATPLFPGHYQPHLPADLGFYDLRVPETRIEQAALARQYGIEGFCYYHYWFGDGRRLLQRPFDEVLATGQPDFPFCLCWANQSWTGTWYGTDRLLVEQTYPGEDDARAHFSLLLNAFYDERYIRVDGLPLLIIFDYSDLLARAPGLCVLWRHLAEQAGLSGLYILMVRHLMNMQNPHALGFDGAIDMRLPISSEHGRIFDHRDVTNFEVAEQQTDVVHFPCIGPTWDNTPRCGKFGQVYVNSSPKLFRDVTRRAAEFLSGRPQEHRLLFLKAWNEWAEGNHLEPDLRYGLAWLDALRKGLQN